MSLHSFDTTSENFESAKEELQSLVKEKFAKPLHSLKSFEELSECTNLSPQTLRRFFGKIDSDNKTTVTSLSLLCNYIGFHDWESFLNHLEKRKSVSEQNRNLIDGMEVFFRNGEKYDTDYFQKTSIVDTLNDYAKIIYSCRENTEYTPHCLTIRNGRKNLRNKKNSLIVPNFEGFFPLNFHNFTKP